MVRPPGEIKIKRKRTDEPVDLLHIQEPFGKKPRCATEYVFCRKSGDDDNATAASVISESAPTLTPHISQSSCSVKDSYGQLKQATGSNSAAAPRRFHIYRSTTPQTADQFSSLIRKRKAETIFIERKPSQDLRARLNNNNTSPSPPTSLVPQVHQIQPQKVPGLAARRSLSPAKPQGVAPIRNVRLPCGTLIPWDVNSQELAALMQTFTLTEIKKNLSESKTENSFNPEKSQASADLSLKSKNQSTRFKPKGPVLRYKDRHPDKLDLDTNTNTDSGLNKLIEDETNNSDWITETYLRIPVSALQEYHAKKYSSHGFLVLDSQEEMEEFYQDYLDFEDEEDEDEDENAENHHSADYPDEEVASDDEFDRGAYRYTNDINEFESDTFSDDEEQHRMRYPWMKSLWSTKREGADTDQISDEEDYISYY